MRRLLVLGLVGCTALALAGAAGAAKPRQRVVSERYTLNPYNQITINYGEPGVSAATVEFFPYKGEGAVAIVLVDDAGFPVRGEIYQDGDTVASFCGETPAPVRITQNESIVVAVFSGTCGSSVTPATRGTITATFLRGASR